MSHSEKSLSTSSPALQVSARDSKSHYGVIIMGAGLSGMAAAIQIKRKMGFEDVLVYEKSGDVGGTWNYNRYPGAACDIPFTFYSFSFAPAYNASSQWAGQKEILTYLHDVQHRFSLNNIVFRTAVESARFSRETGLWTLSIRDLATNTTRTRTCNVLISCLGGLSIPNEPPFDPKEFSGEVWHSARWREDVSLKGKDVVIVGNGCSAAQIVPEIVNQAGTVTQIARSRQSVIRRIPTPDNWFLRFLMRYLPGVGFIVRALIFFVMESFFKITDIEKGQKYRDKTVRDTIEYIKETAPQKYWEVLKPDFDVAAKRRVFDSGYYASLNAPNMELIADDTVTTVKGDKVFTKNGRVVKADVIVLATGFRVHDYLFPVKIINDKGVQLQDQLSGNGIKTFQSTLVHDFPNFFWIMGPQSATGHSSVLFTSECQITLTFRLLAPILAKLRKPQLFIPAPFVEVTKEAEDEFMVDIRREMKKKVWEKDGGVSWYVDPRTGLCHTLYPYSQIKFWARCTFMRLKNKFVWTGC
ncbi:hypothetical protein JCM21900_001468 [Sporobolomyces salmonicolor]